MLHLREKLSEIEGKLVANECRGGSLGFRAKALGFRVKEMSDLVKK